MIALLIVLGSVAAYLGVGHFLARWDAPALWGRARGKEWSEYGRKYHLTEEGLRSYVTRGTLFTLFGWPGRLSYLYALRLTSALDPERLIRELEDAKQRTAELERELGIERR
ncbi:hypothetical protein HPO96_37140 [Kribbella sandramycini]|uniref:Uncharacterized protein n=1 Tax=Kribbella sandramycini TaxID=60450 RepID=A0A7Y4L9V4_9ACTN|nr:hypothetical protein [Kribbella sandramycini]MBB6564428.1 hypothetical protein [Kribbella sandramycini]NOL45886.1 hypothetical protein [Kribbella sandramycini]